MNSNILFNSNIGLTNKIASVEKINDDIVYISQSNYIQVSRNQLIKLNNKIDIKINELRKKDNGLQEEIEKMEIILKEFKEHYNLLVDKLHKTLNNYKEKIKIEFSSKYVNFEVENRDEMFEKYEEEEDKFFKYQVQKLGHFEVYNLKYKLTQEKELNQKNITNLLVLFDKINSLVSLLETEKPNVKELEENIFVFYNDINNNNFKMYFLKTYLEFFAYNIRSYKVKQLKCYKTLTRRMKHLNKMNSLSKSLPEIIEIYISIKEKNDEIQVLKKNYDEEYKNAIFDIRKYKTGYLNDKKNMYFLKPFYEEVEKKELEKLNQLIRDADFIEVTNMVEEYNEQIYNFSEHKKADEELLFNKVIDRFDKFYNLLIITDKIYEEINNKIEIYIREKFNDLFMKNKHINFEFYILKICLDSLTVNNGRASWEHSYINFELFNGNETKEKAILKFIGNMNPDEFKNYEESVKIIWKDSWEKFPKNKLAKNKSK